MQVSRAIGFAMAAFILAPPATFAASPPSLISGQILTPTINAANPKSLPVIKLAISAPAGIEFCTFYLTSPAGINYELDGCVEPPGIVSGSFYALAGPIFSGFAQGEGDIIYGQPSAYLQGGTYTLTVAQLGDWAGNTTSYTGSQLSAIFSQTTISVVNKGMPDYTPPTAVSAHNDTPVVDVSKPNAYVKVTVKVTDDYSGVKTVELLAWDPEVAGSGFGLFGITTVPTTNGNIVTFSSLPSTTAAGTYYIYEILLTDAAGNNSIISSVSGIFGGNFSFQVKN